MSHFSGTKYKRLVFICTFITTPWTQDVVSTSIRRLYDVATSNICVINVEMTSRGYGACLRLS